MGKIKLKGKKHFTVGESIFGQKVHVLINYRAEDYVKWLNKNKIKSLDENTEAMFSNFLGFSSKLEYEDNPDEFIILLNRFSWKIKEQGVLMHEIVHTIMKIWESNNIPFTMDNQEFFAQSVGNLYEDIAFKLLPPKRNGKKNKDKRPQKKKALQKGKGKR